MSDQITSASLNAEPEQLFIRLRAQLGVTSFGLNGIVLEPGDRGRIHRHKGQEEVYVVLAGVLSLGVEGEEQDFPAGSVVRVPPALRRQLVNRGPEPVRLLALGGQLEHVHEGRDAEAFREWADTEFGGPGDIPLPPALPASELRV